MSSELQTNSLYVVLFIRNEPPQPNDFHWALYLHQDATMGGKKYHIKTVGPGWIPDHGPCSKISKEFLLVGLFRIADVPPSYHTYLDETLRSYDDNLNTPGNTCRIWVLSVLALLQQPANGATIFDCQDLPALQEEIFHWGNAHAQSAAANKQPRPTGSSALCGL
ncbi:hypothetical protein N7462_004769 [Penicillium macrosclerotiorum]|uniref:uncharacterized protein n=1 Tax=Penicillium macrosclerotiorum TaxID=303699 RepID=UPI0025473283|nr:uncharacterized protein N7462_004769 [Penicillium macrosclerotiorum]KAJ5690377.1 hypothetical protein N7462_004769 [Penicillium macrosclerotiorum]